MPAAFEVLDLGRREEETQLDLIVALAAWLGVHTEAGWSADEVHARRRADGGSGFHVLVGAEKRSEAPDRERRLVGLVVQPNAERHDELGVDRPSLATDRRTINRDVADRLTEKVDVGGNCHGGRHPLAIWWAARASSGGGSSLLSWGSPKAIASTMAP